jgi:hypothetical protein
LSGEKSKSRNKEKTAKQTFISRMTKQPVKVLNLTGKDDKLKHGGWNSSSIRITPVKSQVNKDGGIPKLGQNIGVCSMQKSPKFLSTLKFWQQKSKGVY